MVEQPPPCRRGIVLFVASIKRSIRLKNIAQPQQSHFHTAVAH